MHPMQREKLKKALGRDWLEIDVDGVTIGFRRSGVTFMEYNKDNPHECKMKINRKMYLVKYVTWRLVKHFVTGEEV